MVRESYIHYSHDNVQTYTRYESLHSLLLKYRTAGIICEAQFLRTIKFSI